MLRMVNATRIVRMDGDEMDEAMCNDDTVFRR